ncbi:MAG: YlbL family protein [Nocardioides sp.]
MTQRTLAAITAMTLVLGLLLAAWLVPLPYSIYRPGVTLNVLGDESPDGKPIIQVSGHPIYRDGGELRMTTVSVTRRDTRLGLFDLLGAWFDRDAAVYPRSSVYPDTSGNEKDDTAEGAVQMAGSQDIATAVAIKQLGLPVEQRVQIAAVAAKAPASDHLETGDLVLSVNGAAVGSADAAVKAIQATPSGEQVRMSVLRDGKQVEIAFLPGTKDGKPYLGVSIGVGYKLPFPVSIDIDPAIGGPSAGLMFSLGIYDTLTPGSMTNGKPIAGTGTINPDGSVGPIGGIQQKIPAAMNDGAKLFLVPADNCADAAGADHGDMRLVKVTTMDSAVTSIEAWAKNPDAKLPTCGRAS